MEPPEGLDHMDRAFARASMAISTAGSFEQGAAFLWNSAEMHLESQPFPVGAGRRLEQGTRVRISCTVSRRYPENRSKLLA